ncbi:TPA_asm: nucleocapsid protein [Tanacetum virus 1]|uniref:Nucleoprotein n=1 Tax=Tanacetum virus 1 TaxID=2977993 RepID=A0A9N7AB61_9RHAB|nr:TPA_asm: nucleocapsid protein [Tanacetum virus 1]
MSRRLLEELRRLRTMHAGDEADGMEQGQIDNNEDVVTAMPTVLQMAGNDEFNEYLRKFAQTPMVEESTFWNGRAVHSHTYNSIDDWYDDQMGNLKIISLQHLTIDEICEIGEYVFDRINGTLTKKAVAGIMLLSYNLMNDNCEYLLEAYDSRLVNITHSVPFELIDETRLCSTSSKNMIMDFNDLDASEAYTVGSKRVAIGYCYLASSYLRLFTKGAENYEKIDKHLKEKFNNFFNFDFPFNEFHPEKDAILAIKKQFELDERLKNTLYVILHAGGGDVPGKDLKDFLYRIHLNYTGLHTYALFLKAMENLQVNCAQLGNIIYMPMFHNQLIAVSKLLDMEKNMDDRHRRQIWKTGRLFSKDFMSVLQVKNCVTFGLVLAYIVVETSPGRRDGPLKIAGLKDATIETKGEAMPIAAKAVYHSRVTILGRNYEEAAVGRLLMKKRTRI